MGLGVVAASRCIPGELLVSAPSALFSPFAGPQARDRAALASPRTLRALEELCAGLGAISAGSRLLESTLVARELALSVQIHESSAGQTSRGDKQGSSPESSASYTQCLAASTLDVPLLWPAAVQASLLQVCALPYLCDACNENTMNQDVVR